MDRVGVGFGAHGEGLPDDPGGSENAPGVDRRASRSRDVDTESKRWEEHWEEVDLLLEMWQRVARSWDNETLLRLVRSAMAEAVREKAWSARPSAGAPGRGVPLSLEDVLTDLSPSPKADAFEARS